MNNLEDNIKPWSKALVKLLSKGPVESSSSVWEDILLYQNEIRNHLAVLGIKVIIRPDEGLAFITQFTDSENKTLGLIPRKPIGFETSILLLVLRQSLEEFDSNPVQFVSTHKFITATEIKEELELFLPSKFNRVKLLKELDSYINKTVDLGYLKLISQKENEKTYEIKRIIKEKITLDILQDFKTKLQEYV